ncbi:hypothetical protein OESDEN_19077, partial [Oesophagostomum dentatum]
MRLLGHNPFSYFREKHCTTSFVHKALVILGTTLALGLKKWTPPLRRKRLFSSNEQRQDSAGSKEVIPSRIQCD